MSFIPVSKQSYPRRPSTRRGPKSMIRGRLESVLVLRLVWSVTILWAEWIHFDRSIARCQWPAVPLSQESFNVLIVADPQLPSMEYSYLERPWILRWLSIKIIDQFIRKSWRLLIQNSHPDAIVFLGDLLDGGITTDDPIKFQSYVDRFYHTFPTPRYLLSSHNQTHQVQRLIHLVGNHDVGLFPSTPVANSTRARKRFRSNWAPGQLNGRQEWANHTIIWLDALSLIEESKRRASGLIKEGEGEVTQFVNGLTGPEMLLPKILFTHVPLWRPERTSCGSLRESRRDIHQGGGVNYQNEISEEATKMVLEKIQPTLVFSGDDHDYCEVIHTLPSTSLANPSPLSIQEISVKSFSMGMGVQQPGYQLLRLSNPARFARAPDEQTTFHHPCLLPNQIRIYTHVYLPLLLITLVGLFGPVLWNLVKRSSAVNGKQAKMNGLPIHHRAHRKSLSRTLMFSKPAPGSRSSSGSSDDGVRSEDESSQVFESRRSRRSASLGLGIGLGIGLGLEGGEGMNPTAGGLSYHSPLNSAHDDHWIPQPSTGAGLEKSEISQALNYAQGAGELGRYPPAHHPHHHGRDLSSRFQSSASPNPHGPSTASDRAVFRWMGMVVGRRMAEGLERWLTRARLLSSSSGLFHTSSASLSYQRPSFSSSKKNPLVLACSKLFSVLWVAVVFYLLVLIWFDW